MRLTFLGTGTSTGIPLLGCGCEVCRSSDPRDFRTRPSLLVEFDGHAVDFDLLAKRLRTYADMEKQAMQHACKVIPRS